MKQQESSYLACPQAGPFDPFFWGAAVRIEGDRPGLFSMILVPEGTSPPPLPRRDLTPPPAVCNTALPDLSFYRIDFPGAEDVPSVDVHVQENHAVIGTSSSNPWKIMLFHRAPDDGLSVRVSSKGGLVLDAAGYGNCRARLLHREGKDRPGVVHLRDAVWGRSLGNGFAAFGGDRLSFRFSVPSAWPQCPFVIRYRLALQGLRLRTILDDDEIFEGNPPETRENTGLPVFKWMELAKADLSAGEHNLVLESSHQAPLPPDAGFALDCIYLSPFINPVETKVLDTPREVLSYREEDILFMERLTEGNPTLAGVTVQGDMDTCTHADTAQNLQVQPAIFGPSDTPCVTGTVPAGSVIRLAWGANRAEVSEHLKKAANTPAPEGLAEEAHNLSAALPSTPKAELSAASMTAGSLVSSMVSPLPGEIAHSPMFRTGTDIVPEQAGSAWHAMGLISANLRLAVKAIADILSRPEEGAPFFRNGPASPAQIFAVWELCQQTGDLRPARAFYAGMFRQLSELTEPDMDGFPAWTLRFSGNPEGPGYPPVQALAGLDGYPEFTSPGTIAMLSAGCRLLEILAAKLNYRNEALALSAAQSNLIRILTEEMYNEENRSFHYINEWTREQISGDGGIESLLPVLTGRLPLRIEEPLLEAMFDPARYWRGFGVGTLNRSSPGYSEETDSVRPGWQWLFLKYLLWKNEVERALELARSFHEAWSRAVTKAGYLPIALGPDGFPRGYSPGGDAGIGLSFFASLRLWGFLTPGIYTLLEDIARSTDRLEFTLSEPGPHRRSGLLMCLPDGNYRVTVGGEEGLAESSRGILALSVPSEGESLRIVVTPL